MDNLHVLYNGGCPICSAEIAGYRRVVEREGLGVTFEDLRFADLEHWALSSDAAAKRLHVRHAGEIVSGLEAFRILWALLPRMRWLAWLTGVPVLRPLAHVLYERVLAPALFAMHKRREGRKERV